MTGETVQFSVATYLMHRRDFRPIEELYRVHKGPSIILGSIVFTLDGKDYMGDPYNTELLFLWEGIIESCRELLETGEPAWRRYEWGGSMGLLYAGWERSHVELRLAGKRQFFVPSEQFMRVTLTGVLHALRLIEKHFPRAAAAAARAIATCEETLKLLGEQRTPEAG
ncbi:MAG TPA: hypothetical protein VFF65_00340 [Phycisphaerales bacterium]|nr:hypothetical protein [Phycisphaerales bacterium]